MNLMTKIATLSAILGMTAAMAAEAAQVRVKCERRADRSVISVDGRGLASGVYVASVTSGANTAETSAQHTIGTEIEFDFASNANDIAQGATAIPANFIQNSVTAKIVTADGFVVVGDTVSCKTR